MARSFRSSFWDVVCAFSNAFYVLFVIGFVLLLLTGLSIAFHESLSWTDRLIVGANSVLVVTLLLGSGYVLRRCNR